MYTDLQLALNIAKALCESIPSTVITISNVPSEYLNEEYEEAGTMTKKKTFGNSSTLIISTLPF